MWEMPVCLVLAAVVLNYVPLHEWNLQLTNDEVGRPAYIILVTMISFVAFYATGLGTVP
jgi:SP family myo-inositol transporter-like MFS transporter 13